MSSYTQAAYAQRTQAITDMRAILDKAGEEGRDLTPDEQSRIQQLDRRADELLDAAKRSERSDELARQAAAYRGQSGDRTEPPTGARTMRTLDIRTLIEAARDNGKAAFEIGQADFDILATRALASSASTVPPDFLSQLVVYEREAAPMFETSTVLKRPYGRDVIIPRLTADATAASTATAEGAGITEDDAVVSSITATTYKLAVMQIVSNELLRDSGVGELEQELARSAGRALGLKANAWFTTGTGSSQPYGLAARASNGGTAAGTAAATTGVGNNYYAWTDVVELQGSVASGYLAKAKYMTSPAGLRAAMKWRQSSTGQPLLEFDGSTPYLWGYPVVVNADVPAPGSAVKGWYFGDLSSYRIVDVGGLRVEASAHHKFGSDQHSIRVIREVAGDLPDVAAIAFLVAADT